VQRADVQFLTIAAAAMATAGIGLASPAHADQASINAAIHDSWESTCNQFRHELTGDPANDLGVLEAVAQNLATFYNMSLHDVPKDLGHRRISAHRPGPGRGGDGCGDARRARRSRVILHADGGCQYVSAQLARFAPKHNLVRCLGRTAVCWDNAQAESFWATMKVEFYDRYLWPTQSAAKRAVGDWIERVYNRRRRHSAIATMRPVEFEDRLNQTAQAS
jgi:Integrase core domain